MSNKEKAIRNQEDTVILTFLYIKQFLLACSQSNTSVRKSKRTSVTVVKQRELILRETNKCLYIINVKLACSDELAYLFEVTSSSTVMYNYNSEQCHLLLH